MANALIVYATKTGTAAKCAELLSSAMGNADVICLDTGSPDLSGYDTIVLGGPIRFGQLHKKVKSFAAANADKLLEKKLGLFLCCGFAENFEQHMKMAFPPALAEHAASKECFGGQMDLSVQKGFDRWIAGMVTKASADKQPSRILTDNIEKMARELA